MSHSTKVLTRNQTFKFVVGNQIVIRILLLQLHIILTISNYSDAFHQHNRTSQLVRNDNKNSPNSRNNGRNNNNNNNNNNISSTVYEILQYPIDSAVSTRTNDGNKSVPVEIPSISCQVLLFSPIWLVVAPELCGPVPTDEALSQFQTVIEYQKLFYPVAVTVTHPLRLTDQHCAITDMKKNNCSIDEMISNLEHINMFMDGHNEIMYLILADTYRRTNNSDRNYNIQQTNLMNGSNPYYNIYSDICTIFMDDNDIIELEDEVNRWYNQHMDTPLWQFVMMLSSDTNGDGVITRDDFNTYYDIPNNNNNRNDSSKPTMANIKMWIILSLLVFCIALCWLGGRTRTGGSNVGNESQPQQPEDRSQSQASPNNRLVTGGAGQVRRNGDCSSNKKDSLTENEFASLPRIKYRTLTYQRKSSISEDNNIVTTTVPVIVMPEFSQQSNDDSALTDGMEDNRWTTKARGGPQQQANVQIIDENGRIANYTNGSSALPIDCCSICLEEFYEEEIVTELPQCLHLFHTNCIGEWLLVRKSDTCPLCKTAVQVYDTSDTLATSDE